jgi:hypothetical protein
MTLGRSTSGAIKIKTDGGLRALECACCNPGPCGGCLSVEEITGASSITIGGNISAGQMTFTLPSQSVSIVDPFVEYFTQDLDAEVAGTATGDLCAAGNSASYIYGGGVIRVGVGVGFSITKGAGGCEISLGASYSFSGSTDFSAGGLGGETIPLANLIGTHSFTFPVTGCRQIEVGYDEEMSQPIYETQCNTVNYSAVIAIS